MKQKNSIVSIFLLLLVAWTSCRDEAPGGSLEIHSSLGKEISLSSQATTFEVEVRTDYSAWSSSTNVDWLSLSQEGNKLSLSVRANAYPTSRVAQVLVLAGGKTQALTVVQSGSDTPFVVASDQLEISRWGESGDIHVDTYVKDWTVQSDADWVHATAVPHEGRIAVVVDAFDEEGERSATLTLTGVSNKVQGTITIKQKGKERYILPYIAWGQDIAKVMSFERGERRSTLTATPSPPTALNPQSYRYYTYKTNHDLFPEVHYETMELSDKFVFRAILTAKDASTLRSEEFIAYLKSQGYEPEVVRTRNTGNFVHTYINQSNKTRASLQVDSKGQRIFFFPVVEQPSAMPTLSSLSLGLTDFHKATPENVSLWEKNRGSVYDSYKSQTESKKASIIAEIYHGVSPFYTHTYIFAEKASESDSTQMVKLLAQSSHILNDLGTVFYQWGDLYLVTKEFSDLMEREGFILVENDSYSYLYVNPDKQLLLWVKTTYWRDGQKPMYNVIPMY